MPKVSVVIPVYGVEQYIERCARSLFEQTLDDIEFIFVDDCTPDKSIEILERIVEEYPIRNVMILHHEMNKGLPTARQTGLKVATGEYIIHCDSDDWVDVDLYEKMYNEAISRNVDVVVCPAKRSNGMTHQLMNQLPVDNVDTFLKDILFARVNWGVWNKMVRSNLYDYNIKTPKYNMGEDFALVCQILLNARSICNLYTDSAYYYFDNPDSISKKPSRGAIITKAMGACENLRIVEDSFKRYNYNTEMLITQKNKQRNILIPTIENRESFQLWLNTFPEINRQIIFSGNIKPKEKIRFIKVLLANIRYWI